MVVVIDGDQRYRGDRRRRQRRADPRRQPAEGQPPRAPAPGRFSQPHRLDHARLEARRRLLDGGEHQQLVGDLGKLLDGAPAVGARRQVPERLGSLLAVGDPERDLGGQISDLLTPHSDPLQ